MGENYLESITNSFPNNVLKEFDYSNEATLSVEIINKELRELFNFIEPGLFDKKIIVVKNLHDKILFPDNNSINLAMNKATLFDCKKDIVIQLFNDRNILMWEDVDSNTIFDCEENIIYLFESNKEKFFVKNKEIDITIRSFGSRYSEEFDELDADKKYHLSYPNIHEPIRIFVEPICD